MNAKLVKEDLGDVLQPKAEKDLQKAARNLFKDIDLWRKVVEPLREPIENAIKLGAITDADEFLQFIKNTMEESGVWDFVIEDIEDEIKYHSELNTKEAAPAEEVDRLLDQIDGYIWADDVTREDVVEFMKEFYGYNPNIPFEEIGPDDFGEWWGN